MTSETTSRIVSVIASLPVEHATFGLGGRQRDYTGASLLAYAQAAGLLDAPSIEHGYFVITASDGARITVGLAEADPSVSPRPILLATTQDGEALRVGVRLVVAREGTRSLLGVTGIEYHTAHAGALGTPASAVAIGGDLRAPGRHGLDGHESHSVTTEQGDGAIAWSGVPLHDLLADAGMFTMRDGEELAQLIVVVTSDDGSYVVLAASEVGPEYHQAAVLLASERDGSTLGDDGPLCLVVPYDRTSARRLARVVSVSLRTG
ncbi:MAG: hypothetical protein DWI48_06995 [Chloroflexi bacterium]|nr:MAG: hypothetical protein DWI48_06995 [Chloroflexota bacterium]